MTIDAAAVHYIRYLQCVLGQLTSAYSLPFNALISLINHWQPLMTAMQRHIFNIILYLDVHNCAMPPRAGETDDD